MDEDEGTQMLAVLQRKIDELETARAEIDLSLAHARSDYGQITNRKTPVYSLPNEILAIIFDAGYHLPQSHFIAFHIAISQVESAILFGCKDINSKSINILGDPTLARCRNKHRIYVDEYLYPGRQTIACSQSCYLSH
jgi:hypothetical protein